MITLFLSCRKSLRHKKTSTSAEPTIEYKSTAILPYVKSLSEQLRRCLQQQGTRVFKWEYHRKTLSSPLNKMARFPGFPVNAVKSTSVRLEDLCNIESENMIQTSDLPVPRPPLFQNTLRQSRTQPALERSKVY